MYIIPLISAPNQTFTSTIPVNGEKLKLKFFIKYNTEQNCWVMNLSNEKNEMLVSAIPLVCGLNVLNQQSYLNLGSAYVVKLNPNISNDRPNEYDLGSNFLLVWGDNE